MAARESDEAALRATLERIRRGQDHGLDTIRPRFDPQVYADVVDDAVHGRRIEDYKQALEKAGFRYYSPRELPLWADGKERTEGEWRHVGLRLAFTENEIVSKFASAEDFWTWLQRYGMRHRAARSGLILP